MMVRNKYQIHQMLWDRRDQEYHDLCLIAKVLVVIGTASMICGRVS